MFFGFLLYSTFKISISNYYNDNHFTALWTLSGTHTHAQRPTNNVKAL